MIALHYYFPLSQIFSSSVSYAGVILIITGLFVIAWGAYAFRKSDTPIKPFEQSTVLVTYGLYRITRNPMYLGMMIILSGTWIFLGSLSPLFVIPVFFLFIQEIFITREEPFLENIFGDQYREYKSKVRRWL